MFPDPKAVELIAALMDAVMTATEAGQMPKHEGDDLPVEVQARVHQLLLYIHMNKTL